MPKYVVMLDGKPVDEINSTRPMVSSQLLDYATNNFHVRSKLGNRHVTKAVVGDIDEKTQTVLVTVTAADLPGANLPSGPVTIKDGKGVVVVGGKEIALPAEGTKLVDVPKKA